MTSSTRESIRREFRRRTTALLGGLVTVAALAGCGGSEGSLDAGSSAPGTPPPASPPPGPTPTPTVTPAPPSTPTPTLAASPAWEAGPGEVEPEVKLTATRFVELLGTWSDSQGDQASAGDRLTDAALDPALAWQTQELLGEQAVASSVTVDYPQYGGLTTTAASVMTLLTQHLLLPDGDRVERQTVLDLRLGRASVEDPWQVQAVSPDRTGPAAGEVSPAALQVLDNPNLRLPEPAVRDIEEGRMDDELLVLLDGLGTDHVLDVHVLYRGHPTNVFDTERASNHSVGRAFDIWGIDGQLVVDPDMPPPLLEQVMLRAAELGATEVGGPFDLNDERPGFFTDRVHRDHIHVGISAGRPPAQP